MTMMARQTSRGTLLGGRVRYCQPARGFRSALEPVLLAAAVPAGAGDHVLEGGAGAGAGLLCLAARIAIGAGVGVERDAALAAVAGENALANGFPLSFVASDLLGFRADRAFDHAFANPPYHEPSGTASPEPGREQAKRAPEGLIAAWATALGTALRPGGTLTLILPPSRLEEALGGCAGIGCGSVRLLPLWPKPGRQAKLLILRAVRDGRAPLALLPGLLLHREDGGFTEPAEAILRSAAPLPL